MRQGSCQWRRSVACSGVALLAMCACATDYTNRVTGNWNAVATWTNGIAVAGCPTNAGDTALIINGTVTANISIPTIAGIEITNSTAVLDNTLQPQYGTNAVIVRGDALLKVKSYNSQYNIPNWTVTLAGTPGHPATVYLYGQHSYCSAAINLPSNAVGVMNAQTASGQSTYYDSTYSGLISAPSNATLNIRQDSLWGDSGGVGNNNTNLDCTLLVGPGFFGLGTANSLGDEFGPGGVGLCTVSNAYLIIQVSTVNPPYTESLVPRNMLLKTNVTLSGRGHASNAPGYSGTLTLGAPTTFTGPAGSSYNNPTTRFYGIIQDDPAVPRATLYCAPAYAGTAPGSILVTNAGNTFTGDIICRGSTTTFADPGALGRNPAGARKKIVVESGTLALNASGTPDWTLDMDLGGVAAVSVEDGARKLTMRGCVVSPATNGVPGTLTVNSHFAFAKDAGNTNCTLTISISAAPTSGVLKVVGNVSALSNAVLNIVADPSMQFADVKNRVFPVVQCNNNVSTQRFAAVTLNKGWPCSVLYLTNGVQVSFVPSSGTTVFFR